MIVLSRTLLAGVSLAGLSVAAVLMMYALKLRRDLRRARSSCRCGQVVDPAGGSVPHNSLALAEEQQRIGSVHDPLTGLANRALFTDVLRRAIARRGRDPRYHFAVLLVDCDRLKFINDALGHSAGDELLRKAAARISSAVRPGDVVARLTGDEFALLLEVSGEVGEAEQVAARLQEVFLSTIRLFEQDVVVTVSTGLVVSDDKRTCPDEFLRDASVAMHRAKSVGRARTVVFTEQMRDGAELKMSLANDLRGAAERGELVVRYQPVWDTVSRRLAGFEALVRWGHPSRGALSPNEFIPIAEESGLIVSMGRWAMFEACRRLRQWDAITGTARPLWISVNLAARQLADPGLHQSVEEVLFVTGLTADRLKLEVTENTILSDEQVARSTLQRLRALGVCLMMDDFGTGHASLTYLHRLPFAAIKIDRYFVGRMHQNPECLEIVRSIIALAQSLSMEAVAEGVDHARQLEQLESLGCHYVQGFLLGRPLSAVEAEELVTRVASARDGREEFDPRDHEFGGVETALTLAEGRAVA